MRIPERLRPALAIGMLLVLASQVTRISLWWRPEVDGIGIGRTIQAFALGFAFDLVAALYVVTPLALWLILAPNRWARSRLFGATVVLACGLAAYAASFLAVSEWLFWDEFGDRFNFIAVDYLLYTQEVVGNIWQSYPTGRILAALAALSLAVAATARRPLLRWSAAPRSATQLGGMLAGLAFAVVAATLGISSDQRRFSVRDADNALAGNGLYQFFAALRRNELDFEQYYATLPLKDALATVRDAYPGSAWIDAGRDGMERLVAGGEEKRLNVVLVSVESLGAEFMGAYGDNRGLTPNLDRLARESLWFSTAYATGNRTVRGLEALALALPPTPGQSIVRRPHNEKLFSLGSVFEDKDYAVLFAYGGYGYFDNMNAFFDANDYRVIDRRAIPASRIAFENVWGVADEHLFDQVIDEIDREKSARPDRPVFTHVMTTSNHRPYTYPSGRIDIPPGKGREGAVKYTDYALGRLIESARRRPWFRDTVFVITADHGANARGSAQIPVDKYRIPVLFYSPAHIPARRVDRLMSQIDIAPTLLGLLDFRYYSKFLGRDLLHADPSGDRAYVGNFQTLGYLREGRMVVLQPQRKVDHFRMTAAGPIPTSVDEAGARLVREAIAGYQVASHLFRNGLYLDEEQLEPSSRTAALAR